MVINGYHLRVIINSGAKGNFILIKTIVTLKITTLVKVMSYRLVTVNGSDIRDKDRIVKVETKLLIVSTPSRHEEELLFDIV